MNSSKLKIMTFNIRYDNDWDTGHSWESRKQRVVDKIKSYQPDTLGIQEGMMNQVHYLMQQLPEYDYVGVARGDGIEKDEFAAIFYKKDELTLMDSNTFWLSETPEKAGSFGWDAACTRICTWSKFRDNQSKNIFYHFNTHFDHEGKVAQKESAQLILHKIKEIAGTYPAILTGDLNITPDFEAYKILTGRTRLDESLLKEYLTDTCVDKHNNPITTGTFTGFGSEETYCKIDYIFIKNNIEVEAYNIWDDQHDIITSDHYPVTAEIIFNKLI